MTGPTGRFEPLEQTLTEGTPLYRIFSDRTDRTAVDFNPGFGAPTRFAFFKDSSGATVPVLYAASTEEAAVCETLLHDVPASGGTLLPADYRDKVMALLRPARQLRLASFMGLGLRRLKVEHQDITSTGPGRYGETVLWGQAAHQAGFDGAIWMSNRCNTDTAVVLFGDRVKDGDLVQDPGFGRLFEMEPDRAWLTDLCVPLHVQVRW